LLEKEAKRYMAEGGEYRPPIVSTIKEKATNDGPNPSNLPYLHKNPAIWLIIFTYYLNSYSFFNLFDQSKFATY
jgi:hypothetical protein